MFLSSLFFNHILYFYFYFSFFLRKVTSYSLSSSRLFLSAGFSFFFFVQFFFRFMFSHSDMTLNLTYIRSVFFHVYIQRFLFSFIRSDHFLSFSNFALSTRKYSLGSFVNLSRSTSYSFYYLHWFRLLGIDVTDLSAISLFVRCASLFDHSTTAFFSSPHFFKYSKRAYSYLSNHSLLKKRSLLGLRPSAFSSVTSMSDLFNFNRRFRYSTRRLVFSRLLFIFLYKYIYDIYAFQKLIKFQISLHSSKRNTFFNFSNRSGHTLFSLSLGQNVGLGAKTKSNRRAWNQLEAFSSKLSSILSGKRYFRGLFILRILKRSRQSRFLFRKLLRVCSRVPSYKVSRRSFLFKRHARTRIITSVSRLAFRYFLFSRFLRLRQSRSYRLSVSSFKKSRFSFYIYRFLNTVSGRKLFSSYRSLFPFLKSYESFRNFLIKRSRLRFPLRKRHVCLSSSTIVQARGFKSMFVSNKFKRSRSSKPRKYRSSL